MRNADGQHGGMFVLRRKRTGTITIWTTLWRFTQKKHYWCETLGESGAERIVGSRWPERWAMAYEREACLTGDRWV